MIQQEFLKQLATALAPLSDTERSRILDYYREMICDGIESGKEEQEMIFSFGTPQEIAAQILEESAAEDSEPATALPAVQPPSSGAYAARGPVHTILVDARHISVEIHPVQDGPVQVHFSPLESDRVSISEQNGVFSFRHTMEFSFFHWRNLFFTRRIMVDIPSSFHGDLQVTTCNARLCAENLSSLGFVQLSTSNGRLMVSSLTCSSLDAETSNGALELHSVSGDRCTAKTSNGHITANFCSFSGGLSLYTSNAAIRAQSLSSDHLDLVSSNAAVCAVILGDLREYAIHSHTSNASNSLPPELIFPGQTKCLNVQTNNAVIDVKFA